MKVINLEVSLVLTNEIKSDKKIEEVVTSVAQILRDYTNENSLIKNYEGHVICVEVKEKFSEINHQLS